MSGLLESLKSMYAHDAIVLAGIENGSIRGIPLTRGKIAIVDAEDYEKVSKFKWSTVKDRNTFYASCHPGKTFPFRMHRIVMDLAPGDGIIIDHVNKNGIDNRKENLRKVSHMKNIWNSKKRESNTTGFIGICFHRQSGLWHARIRCGKNIISCKYHKTAELAAAAFDRTAIKYRGENTTLNFPDRRSDYVSECL